MKPICLDWGVCDDLAELQPGTLSSPVIHRDTFDLCVDEWRG